MHRKTNQMVRWTSVMTSAVGLGLAAGTTIGLGACGDETSGIGYLKSVQPEGPTNPSGGAGGGDNNGGGGGGASDSITLTFQPEIVTSRADEEVPCQNGDHSGRVVQSNSLGLLLCMPADFGDQNGGGNWLRLPFSLNEEGDSFINGIDSFWIGGFYEDHSRFLLFVTTGESNEEPIINCHSLLTSEIYNPSDWRRNCEMRADKTLRVWRESDSVDFEYEYDEASIDYPDFHREDHLVEITPP